MATPAATHAPVSVPPSAPSSSSSNDSTVQVDGAGAKPVLIPRCSTWFRLDAINPIEQRMLPEFFTSVASAASATSSKTSQIYMKYRNYMVHSYRQQPHVYLTATACRRNLAGDACAILRVHEFLTHWGLINYNVPPHAMPPSIHPNYALKPDSTVSSSTKNGLLAVLTDDPKTQNKPQTWLCEACGMNAVEFELSQDAKLKAVGSNGNGVTAAAVAANGHAKELPLGAFCLRPGSGLCGDCLLNGAFPEALDASDFVRVKAPAAWREEETSRLLAAVSSGASNRSDEACDWNEIAAKVKTKTAEECLLHFLEMSIVDKVHGVSTVNGSSEPSVLQRPFEYASAMNASVVDMATLVAGVDPFVAKAAARAAIQAVKKLHTIKVQKGDAAAPEASTVKAEVGAAAAVTASTATANVGDASVELANAAAAVANSAQAAGIASDAIKEEVKDVTMEDSSAPATSAAAATTAPASSEENSVIVTKESVAVAREASGATTVALLATRAHAIAMETATGPVRDLVAQLLQNQLQQMELKMQQLSVLEATVRAEKDQLARDRYQLYMDRLALGQAKSDSSSATMSEL